MLEERPCEGLQAEHAVFGGQRILPAVDGRRLRHSRWRSSPTWHSRRRSMPVFGYGCAVFMQSDIVNFQRQGWRAGGDSGRAWRRFCRRTSFSTWPAFRTWPRSDRASCCRAARRTIWRSSKRKSISSARSFRAPRQSRRSSSTSIAANRARSARPWRRCACGATASGPASSASTRCGTSRIAPRAMKRRAAISARTTVCAPSSTSIQRRRAVPAGQPMPFRRRRSYASRRCR